MIVGAAAAIFDELKRLLVIKENYDRRRYGFPGGRLEPGETPSEAVVREVREEAGVEVRIDGLVGVYELSSHVEAHLFACTIVDGIPDVANKDEIDDVAWFLPTEIPEPRTNLVHHALPDVVAGRRGVERRGLKRIN